jgi:hypothetical protein
MTVKGECFSMARSQASAQGLILEMSWSYEWISMTGSEASKSVLRLLETDLLGLNFARVVP